MLIVFHTPSKDLRNPQYTASIAFIFLKSKPKVSKMWTGKRLVLKNKIEPRWPHYEEKKSKNRSNNRRRGPKFFPLSFLTYNQNLLSSYGWSPTHQPCKYEKKEKTTCLRAVCWKMSLPYKYIPPGYLTASTLIELFFKMLKISENIFFFSLNKLLGRKIPESIGLCIYMSVCVES
jgi:hypothetical protein